MFFSTLSGARRPVAASVVVLALAAFLGFTSQSPAANAAPLTNASLTQTGGFATGVNSGQITVTFTTATATTGNNTPVSIKFVDAARVGSDCNYQASCTGLTVTANGTNPTGTKSVQLAGPDTYVSFEIPANVPANTTFVVTLAAGTLNRTGPSTSADVKIYDSTASSVVDSLVLITTAPSATVSFNANGGAGSIGQQTASVATNLTSNTTQITRSGYNFTGWNTAANGSGTPYANNGSYPFSASATLYAQWTLAAELAVTGASDASGGITLSVLLLGAGILMTAAGYLLRRRSVNAA